MKYLHNTGTSVFTVCVIITVSLVTYYDNKGVFLFIPVPVLFMIPTAASYVTVEIGLI